MSLPFRFASRIPGFFAFTSTREGGVSEGPYASLNLGGHVGDDPAKVSENRRRLWSSQGLRPESAFWLAQVHGTELCPARPGGPPPEADGSYTASAGVPLCIGHADCLALVLVDPEKRAAGMAHAGWRGALGGIAAKLVSRLAAEYGSRPADLWAGLSPCLGPCCLELSGKEHALFEAAWAPLEGLASPLVDGHFKLDLWSLVRRQLRQAGLREERLETQAFCTSHEPGRFFSHRRDKGKTGRMVTACGFLF